MGTIRFGAAERPKLLARAVIGTLDSRGALYQLARAFEAGDGKRFDDLLTEHYRDVALGALGIAADPTVGVDPETGGEAKVEK